MKDLQIPAATLRHSTDGQREDCSLSLSKVSFYEGEITSFKEIEATYNCPLFPI